MFFSIEQNQYINGKIVFILSDTQTLKSFEKESIYIYTLRLVTDTDLVLSYEWNGKKIERILYNKLNSNDLRNISIILIEKDEKLKYSVLVGNDVKR